MKFRDLHPNIKWRFVVGFLTSLSYMMVGPFLVIFFSNKIGAGITGALATGRGSISPRCPDLMRTSLGSVRST